MIINEVGYFPRCLFTSCKSFFVNFGLMHFVQLLTGLKLKKKIMYVVYGIGFFHLSTREIVILPLIYAVNSFS